MGPEGDKSRSQLLKIEILETALVSGWQLHFGGGIYSLAPKHLWRQGTDVAYNIDSKLVLQ